MERLMKAGARDVHYVPVFMKKNRPAWVLNVICKEEDMETLQNIIFEETTTIGIRYSRMERTILPRETRTLPTPWGEVLAKVCTLNGKEQIGYKDFGYYIKVFKKRYGITPNEFRKYI